MGGIRSTHGRDVKCLQNCVRKSRRERPFGRPKRRWKDI